MLSPRGERNENISVFNEKRLGSTLCKVTTSSSSPCLGSYEQRRRNCDAEVHSVQDKWARDKHDDLSNSEDVELDVISLSEYFMHQNFFKRGSLTRDGTDSAPLPLSNRRKALGRSVSYEGAKFQNNTVKTKTELRRESRRTTLDSFSVSSSASTVLHNNQNTRDQEVSRVAENNGEPKPATDQREYTELNSQEGSDNGCEKPTVFNGGIKGESEPSLVLREDDERSFGTTDAHCSTHCSKGAKKPPFLSHKKRKAELFARILKVEFKRGSATKKKKGKKHQSAKFIPINEQDQAPSQVNPIQTISQPNDNSNSTNLNPSDSIRAARDSVVEDAINISRDQKKHYKHEEEELAPVAAEPTTEINRRTQLHKQKGSFCIPGINYNAPGGLENVRVSHSSRCLIREQKLTPPSLNGSTTRRRHRSLQDIHSRANVPATSAVRAVGSNDDWKNESVCKNSRGSHNSASQPRRKQNLAESKKERIMDEQRHQRSSQELEAGLRSCLRVRKELKRQSTGSYCHYLMKVEKVKQELEAARRIANETSVSLSVSLQKVQERLEKARELAEGNERLISSMIDDLDNHAFRV